MSRHVQIAIVGSGFSGLGTAIRLKREGFNDFVVFERANEVGGTWRDNTYPGCACDVRSHLYSFSFAPNPNWSHVYSRQPEIFEYLKNCADKFEVRTHIRFNHEVSDGRWDEAARVWRITTSRGNYTANFLVLGTGPLCEPKMPKVPGLDRFEGTMFHSARWNHEHDLHGRDVAVIGTGASAVQFVPQIQPQVKTMRVFQRTPAWVVPRLDRAITPGEQRLLGWLPFTQKIARAAIYSQRELYVVGFHNPRAVRMLESLAARYLESAVPDAELRAKLTPNFRLGCKRVLISNEFLQTLARPNVEVVTDGIAEIGPRSIVTNDGKERYVDTLIFGTGFHVTDAPFAKYIRGIAGSSLAEVWRGSPQAHLGTTVVGFPNLFILAGPNTGIGHTSVVFMVESQLELVLGALRHLRDKGLTTVAPTAAAQTAFVRDVEAQMKNTVWTAGGCSSYYLDETGRNSTLWPGFTFKFRQKARFRANEYELR